MNSGSKSNQVQILHKWVAIGLMMTVPTVPRAFYAGCSFRENVLKPFFVNVVNSNDKIENVGRIVRETDESRSIETLSNRSLRIEFSTNESPYLKVFSLERSTYTTGVQQSSDDENVYHEALVHPGMFAHNFPAQIAIIGGGEEATLREILKHDTVENVKMFKNHENMVDTFKKYSSALFICSDIMGSAGSCFDDDRVEIVYEDPFAWFVNNGKVLHSDESSNINSNERKATKPEEKELFDVIVIDTFDPQKFVECAAMLHKGDAFFRNLYKSLSSDGILVIQMGSSPEHVFPQVIGSGFKSVHVYNEVRQQYLIYIGCTKRKQGSPLLFGSFILSNNQVRHGFSDPWNFMVACKSHTCRHNWYLNQASVDIRIHSNLRRTKSGLPSLTYFDGAAMSGYQMPSKKWEIFFCRHSPNTKSCKFVNGFDKKTKNTPITDFEVKMSAVGKNSGRGVYAKNDIPKGSFISLETAIKKVHFDHEVTDTIEFYAEVKDTKSSLDRVTNYMYGYGFQADYKVNNSLFHQMSFLFKKI